MATIDSILLEALQTTAASITWWSALSGTLEAIVVGSIVSLSINYFEAHSRDDHWTTIVLVLVNTAFCLGQLGMNLWQTHQLINLAGTNFATVLPFDVKADMVCLFGTGYHNLCATTFFAYRAWRLSGKKWYILPVLVAGITTSFVLCLVTLVHGIQLPELTLTNLLALVDWNNNLSRLVTAWTSVSMTTDIFICSLMFFLILRTQARLSFSDLPIVRRILLLIFECMVPPTIAVTAMLVVVVKVGATDANLSCTVSWIVGPLYFQPILIALVGRDRMRKEVSGVQQVSGGVQISVTRVTNSNRGLDVHAIDSTGGSLTLQGHSQSDEIPLSSFDSMPKDDDYSV